jgi:ABC-type transporter lipoprotein component MlaA
MARRHLFVFITALFSLSSQIYSPLGGAYFNIVPVNIRQNVSVVLSSAVDPSAFLSDVFITTQSILGVCYPHLIGMLSLDADN